MRQSDESRLCLCEGGEGRSGGGGAGGGRVSTESGEERFGEGRRSGLLREFDFGSLREGRTRSAWAGGEDERKEGGS